MLNINVEYRIVLCYIHIDRSSLQRSLIMTVEQLVRFENYYFSDDELLSSDLEFIISNSTKSRIEKGVNRIGDIQYDIRDYYYVFDKCEVINNDRIGYSFSARYRCIAYEKEKQKRYIDFRNDKFNPIGNAFAHTVKVGNYCFEISTPFEYNFLIVLLKWSDELFENGEFPIDGSVKAPMLYISQDDQIEYGLKVDLDSRIPVAIGYAEMSILDEMFVRPFKPLKGGMYLYISEFFKPCVSINEKRASSRIFGPNVRIEVFSSPYVDTDHMLFRGRYFFGSLDKVKILGDPEKFLIYVSVEGINKETVEIRLFSLKDYYNVASWLVVALYYNYIEYGNYIYDYWPSYYQTEKRNITNLNSINTIDREVRGKKVDTPKGISKTATIKTETTYGNEIFTNRNNTDKLDAMVELETLVGLDSIKRDVKELISLVKMQKLRHNKGLKSVPISLHLVFTGNPGTGKTTVARILAQLYKEIGVLKKGQIVEVDRADLVAGYVGQTAIKTHEKIQEAMGGVLFIDEAYTLAKGENDYGQEAIETILKEMEDSRESFVVIVAGYDDQMKKFINSNPGLKSRFNKYFHFPDYSADELIDIFLEIIHKYDYTITEEAMKIVIENIVRMEKNKSPDFANAREIRNYFEQIITRQAMRISDKENLENTDILKIEIQDV